MPVEAIAMWEATGRDHHSSNHTRSHAYGDTCNYSWPTPLILPGRYWAIAPALQTTMQNLVDRLELEHIPWPARSASLSRHHHITYTLPTCCSAHTPTREAPESVHFQVVNVPAVEDRH